MDNKETLNMDDNTCAHWLVQDYSLNEFSSVVVVSCGLIGKLT